jgi:hypothetical protein
MEEFQGKLRKDLFWWRGILKLLTTYKGLSQATLGVGDTILICSDLLSGKILNLEFPQLFSFAINNKITIKEAVETQEFQDLFHLPLSEEAFEQFCELDI